MFASLFLFLLSFLLFLSLSHSLESPLEIPLFLPFLLQLLLFPISFFSLSCFFFFSFLFNQSPFLTQTSSPLPQYFAVYTFLSSTFFILPFIASYFCFFFSYVHVIPPREILTSKRCSDDGRSSNMASRTPAPSARAPMELQFVQLRVTWNTCIKIWLSTGS